ncbi:hypothetical protein CPT03_07115 [Pedobacter ginsengisoli]|uniref:Uncharacterized protein n=1 Tax=Pedobacter ginsengisoli TaxID=363852 RepID=A0A2D1U3T5_9SPHI|nr:hypothetical protein [Pedobacter ginsengisoli]ATP56255.1 hypothetical protein CPT03_07115 [Pedobacter ginsengisoli]
MRDYNTVILEEAIADLDLSLEFKDAAEKLGYKKLKDIVSIRTAALEKKPGFNILLVHEYVSFMESAGLGALIDPRLV